MAATHHYRRVRSQLPSCYHEGYLEKKSIKDKIVRKLWTSLCGNSLFFFNNTKDSVYVEKLELSDLISVSDDSCCDQNLSATRFTLHMKNEDIKMIAPTLEARELWKGFMLSIAKLTVPTSLNLLPGQIHMMKEIIEKEKKRQRLLSAPPAAQSSDPYIYPMPDMPLCYNEVSRVEAEILLETKAHQGNLLLRPGHDGTSFALTTRQNVNGSVFKHYRVSRKHEGGFTIDLETPITCATLHDVVNCLVEKSSGVLVPFQMEEHYDQKIIIVKKNEENGEISEHCPKHVSSSAPPVPPPKPVTRNYRSSSEPIHHEAEYLNISEIGDYEVDDSASLGPPVPARQHLPHQISMPPDLNTNSEGERKALLPPGYNKTRSSSLTKTTIPKYEQQHVMNELLKVINSRRPALE